MAGESRWWRVGVTALGLAVLLALALGGAPVAPALPAEFPDLDAACLEGNPYLAAVCYPVDHTLPAGGAASAFVPNPATMPAVMTSAPAIPEIFCIVFMFMLLPDSLLRRDIRHGHRMAGRHRGRLTG